MFLPKNLAECGLALSCFVLIWAGLAAFCALLWKLDNLFRSEDKDIH